MPYLKDPDILHTYTPVFKSGEMIRKLANNQGFGARKDSVYSRNYLPTMFRNNPSWLNKGAPEEPPSVTEWPLSVEE